MARAGSLVLRVSFVVIAALTTNAAAMYHPTAGRWLQQDPIGYSGGWNLYEYGASGPLAGADPQGLIWDIQRNPEQPRANAISGKPSALGRWSALLSALTDTMYWLGLQQGLEPSEYQLWAELPNGNIKTVFGTKILGQLEIGDWICPGETVSVPNLVVAIRGDIWVPIGAYFMADIEERLDYYRSKKYKVVHEAHGKTKSTEAWLKDKDLVAFFYYGHGAAGNLAPSNNHKDVVAPSLFENKTTHHRLLELMLLGCETAKPMDSSLQRYYTPNLSEYEGRTDMSPWELNVSRYGSFTGVVGSPSYIAIYVTHPGGIRPRKIVPFGTGTP